MSYFQLLPCSRGVVTAGSATYVIWQIFTLDALPDTTLTGFVSPPRIKLLGKCVEYSSVESHFLILIQLNNSAI